MNCPNCNSPVDSKFAFCPVCGTRLRSEQTFPLAGGLDVIPSSVDLDRYRAAGVAATGERRRVAVLFVDISDFTRLSSQLGPEESIRFVNMMQGVFIPAVYRYEGLVDKLTGDGLMALFGAPIAHENDAERAVRAAFDMQSGLAEIASPLQQEYRAEVMVRIGINVGPVIVGQLGNDLRMEYTAIGETVNLARRVQEAADKGAICVSADVMQATRAFVAYRSLGLRTLKGFDQPQPLYQTLGLRAQPGSPRGLEGLVAPLTGRDRELGRLKDLARPLFEQGNGALAMIAGEAGIGKSRLTRELIEFLNSQSNPPMVVSGGAMSYRRSAPLWLLREVVRNAFGLTGNAGPVEVESQIESQLARFRQIHPEVNWEADRPFLQYLMVDEVSPEIAGRIDALEPGQVQQRVFIVIRRIFEAFARQQPLAVLFDDLHWADDATLDFIESALDLPLQRPIMLVCIARSTEGPALTRLTAAAKMRPNLRYAPISLKPLQEADMEALIDHLLSRPALPAVFRSAILQRTEGSPFFLEEILRTLIDRQALVRSNGTWAATEGAPGVLDSVPPTLEGLIRAKIDQVPVAVRRLLECGAVMGHRFDAELARRVVAIPIADTIAGGLVTGGVLAPSSLSGTEWEFAHHLIGAAIYGGLPERDRQALHLRVAEMMEKTYADRYEEVVEALAEQFWRSSSRARALPYLIMAAEKSARLFALTQAREYYRQAGEALGPEGAPETRMRIAEGQADLFLLGAHFAEAEQHLRAALALADQKGDSLQRAKLHRKIGEVLIKRGEMINAKREMEVALKLIEGDSGIAVLETAQIVGGLGWIAFRRSELQEAEQLLGRALGLVEDSQNYGLVAQLSNRLGGVYAQLGDLDRAMTVTRRSAVLRETVGDLDGMAQSLNNLGVLAEMRGDYAVALQSYQKSKQIQQQIGNLEMVAFTLCNMSVVQTHQGAYAEAEANLNASLELARAIGQRWQEALILMNLGRVKVETAQWDSALRFLRDSLAISDQLSAGNLSAQTLYLIGECQLRLNNVEEADETARRSLKRLDVAEGATAQFAQRTERGRTLRLLGLIAQARGQSDLALGHLKQSREIFESVRDPYERAKTLYELGRLHASRRDVQSARLALAEARLIFGDLNAGTELARCEALAVEIGSFLPGSSSQDVTTALAHRSKPSA
ncbi:MAG: tetratricopeptide repeat protein [Chloroflexi bacterium]|nr:tetratricopeptide repeat protein [Chloroflexota bacterium]